MNRQRPTRRPWHGSPGRLLLLMALIAGVFAMHGFQVTTGPTERSGIPGLPAPIPIPIPFPVAALSAAGEHEPHGAGPAGSAGPMAAQPPADSGAGAHADGRSSCDECGGAGGGHAHPGGQVCLGLLALGSIIVMLAVSARRSDILTVVRALITRFVRPPAGRPPPRPDIYQLAVLLQ